MSTSVPRMTGGPAVVHVLRDSWTIALRLFSRWAAQPGLQALTLLFPVLLLLMWQWLIGGQLALPGGADYLDLLLPGMLALSMFFGLEATTTGVAADVRAGLTDRLRSMPIAATSVLLGRAVAELAHAVAGLVVVAAAGVALGWRPEVGVAGALAALGLLLLLRFAMLWLGILYGLTFPAPEAVAGVQVVVWPFAFLSSAFVAPGSMPAVLGAIAECNPLSATATTVRELVGAPAWPGGGWGSEHAELLAIAWPLALLAVLVPLAARSLRRLGD